MRMRINKRYRGFVAGLSVGLVMGVGMLAGSLVAQFGRQQPVSFPTHALHASATHGGESFAMATGPISDGVEGVFFLDFLTGELQCSVLNPRSGTLAGVFKQNVLLDLGAVKDKNPQYLMVTGNISFRSLGGGIRPADTVVYVLDANSGNFAAYAIPWNPQAINYNVAQANVMQVIGKGSIRVGQVRNE